MFFVDRGEYFVVKIEVKAELFKGFRDSYSKLIKEGYNIQIPTCDKLENPKS
jgi:hypothetical protein